MSRTRSVLSWLENTSDLLNPIVVKEVRQIVRGREFNYALSASLVVGLAARSARCDTSGWSARST